MRRMPLFIVARLFRITALSLGSALSFTAALNAALFGTWTPTGDLGGPDFPWIAYTLGLSTDDGSNIAALDVTLRGTFRQQWSSFVEGDPFAPTPSGSARGFDSHLTPIGSALIINLNEDSDLSGSDPVSSPLSSTAQIQSGTGTTLSGIWGVPGIDQTSSMDFAYIVVPRNADLSQFQFDLDVATHDSGVFNSYGLHGCSLFSAGCNFTLTSTYNPTQPAPPPAPVTPPVIDEPVVTPEPPVDVQQPPNDVQKPPVEVIETGDPPPPPLPDGMVYLDPVPDSAIFDNDLISVWTPGSIRQEPIQLVDWSNDPPYELRDWLALREQYSLADIGQLSFRDVQELLVRSTLSGIAHAGTVSDNISSIDFFDDAAPSSLGFRTFADPLALQMVAFGSNGFMEDFAPQFASGSMSDADAVPAPEPTSAMLIVLASIAMLFTRRRN